MLHQILRVYKAGFFQRLLTDQRNRKHHWYGKNSDELINASREAEQTNPTTLGMQDLSDQRDLSICPECCKD